jgi:hypothetical protein
LVLGDEVTITDTDLMNMDSKPKQEEIWNEYLTGKRKKPVRFQAEGAKHPYFCCAFVQRILSEIYGEELCKKEGVLKKDYKEMGGTWGLLNRLRERGNLVWEREEKSSETLKRLRKEKPKSKYRDLVSRLKETNTKEAERLLQPGDIIIAYYPGSLFKKNIVTHTCIYLGEKQGEKYVLQEWGDSVEIMSLRNLYSRIPGGIDAVGRIK